MTLPPDELIPAIAAAAVATLALVGWVRASWLWRRASQEGRRVGADLARSRDDARAAQAELGRLRIILDAVPAAVGYIDERGVVRAMGRRRQSWLGVVPGQIVGRPLIESLPPGLAQSLAPELSRALAGQPAGCELAASDNGAAPLLASLVPDLDDRGAVRGVVLVAEDASRHQLAERALRLSEAKMRAVVDATVDGVITIDEHGAIETFNRAAEGIFGYGATEVVGRNVNMLMPEPYHSAHDGYLRNYQATGLAKIIGIGREVQGRRKDGSVFPMDLAVGEARVQGRRLFAGIIRDITERKHGERALRQAKEEAERANLAKSKFLAAASHDLRQPVQALFFFAFALSHKLRDHPARAVVDDLERSLDALNILLDSLLDISRLDAGVVVPQDANFAVATLLDRLAAEFGPVAEAKGLSLRAVASTAVVRSDPALLSRVIQNLMANAIRYTVRGRVLIGCRRRGLDRMAIEVWDTGIGIPADRLDDIFEEFTQIGNPERDRAQGLGLGLAIVLRLSRLLDHRVRVRSRPGHGSVFSIEVPLVESRPREINVRQWPARGVNGRQLVIVIDDEATVLRGLALVLEDWGYEVMSATSEEEALALLRAARRRPAVILADYRLRDGHTGSEAIQHIRVEFNEAIPSIIITGDTAPERLREAEASGFSILHKPVQPPELQTLLDKTLATVH